MKRAKITGNQNQKDKGGREQNSTFRSFVSLSIWAMSLVMPRLFSIEMFPGRCERKGNGTYDT